MQPQQKLRIGELLVQEGLLTQEQVEHVLATQKERQQAAPFGEICEELGFLSTASLGKILRKHHQRILLGELLVHLGLVSQEQIQAALAQQKKTKQKLGTLLIEKGWMSETALVSVLYQQVQAAKQAQSSKRKAGKFDALVTAERISQQDLDAAQAEAREQQRPIEAVLMEKYQISKQEIGYALSTFYHCPFIEYDASMVVDPALVRGINPNYLKANYWIPLRATEGRVEVLIDDPHAFHKTQDIKRLFQDKEIRYSVGLQEDILRYVNAVSARPGAKAASEPITAILGELAAEGREEQGEESSELVVDENDSAIVRLTNQIISDAVRMNVSDIHIEPYGDKRETVVRFRTDGHCYEYLKVQPGHRRALASRLKIMARLDIAERRKPQDGKIRLRLPDHEVELRVATVPTAGIGNEDVVMRILAASEPLPLDKLQMSERNFREFTQLLQKPYGIILCVGPTGSGKTTTLHSALRSINTLSKKIWTAEDPVEITQYGLRQVQVHPKIGLDFAAVLRAFLRADPDVIMVGEIRDHETAEISIKASLTGHLVLSTLHTNSAAETVTRLLDMGMDPFNFADALLGVLAQRLARTICPQCKELYSPSREEYDALAYGYGEEAFAGLGIPYDERFRLARGKGCEACHQTGYKGRVGLHELLVATEEFKSLIHTRAPVAELLRVAVAQGMATLVQDGIIKCIQGWTDYNQVKAVAIK
jgi:type II secretory ATPase GspE/PulE/Tfp pilus assembly ATPase PilB-like protein